MKSNQHKSEFDAKAERPGDDAPAEKRPTELKVVYPLQPGVQRPQ
ncbi:MAG TPA: hypothetical protein VEF76_06325 [Patescibacteria group bacterium]|nr:hypothetical protein [Patescibacteria group bacterium]